MTGAGRPATSGDPRIPTRTGGQSGGVPWSATLDFDGAEGDHVRYTPGMTLRWLVTLSGRPGPAVQLLGPPTPAGAIQQLRHLVDAWMRSHPEVDHAE